MARIDWMPLQLTLELAVTTVVALLLLGLPIAFALSRSHTAVKPLLQAIVSMPLVLPPSVLGFYLLVAFSPANAFGKLLEDYLGLRLIFSFEGLVVASCIYSLPFMVNPILAGIESIPPEWIKAARVLGKSRPTIFFRIMIPNIRPALITAMVMTFAHTIGEFGVILMIGGSIPDQTRVASIAIFEEVEAMNYATANQYALILLLLAFFILVGIYGFNRQQPRTF